MESAAAPDTRELVKGFVLAFVKGRLLSVLSVNGGLVDCHVSLDRKLSKLSLQRPGRENAQKRSLPLEAISEICKGRQVGDLVDLPVDDLCVTLIMSEEQAVGFRFNDFQERDAFALCLSTFVEGRRKVVNRKRDIRHGK